jgi:drug/metabolite transporter (DMT)-like permease
MKPMVLAGIVLAVLGVAALAYQGFSYNSRDTLLQVGDVKIDAERQKSISLPPVAGIALLVGGVVLIAVGSRKG